MCLAGQQLADRAVRAGVKQFLFASSGSVYGLKDEPNVTEDLTLVPISVYNKTKMVAERVFPFIFRSNARCIASDPPLFADYHHGCAWM